MNLGGWQKVSLMDFPNKIATVVFTNGCVFHCDFCYNPDLVDPPFTNHIPESEFFNFLKQRRKLVEAVVITGGEPTIHADLKPFIQKIIKLGYAVKLDTNGYHPQVLDDLIQSGLLDYLAMDIKAPLAKYSNLVGIKV
jgi:pyruvate formate lyase activating enzyme